MEKEEQIPLHELHVDKFTSNVNIFYALLQSLFVSTHLYHRFYFLFLIYTQNDSVITVTKQPTPLLPWLLLLIAELLLFVFWLAGQAPRVRPVSRTVFTERLPPENQLPSLDVLICTADPNKEPTLEVMNTVVSAMALDYAPDKLHVYISDDGGSSVTLKAVKEAWAFAAWWVPFCRKYEVKCRCPMAYFAEENSREGSHQFIPDRILIEEKYRVFKQRVTKLGQDIGEEDKNRKTNHPPHVQVMSENDIDPTLINPDHAPMPSLVYVAREKRPTHSHHFKAGALNVLLRVSALLSNSPVVLVLDCDMYCNDPTSPKQAMCFFLDRQISPSLGFVQFPQRFHNVTETDLYDTSFKWGLEILLRGLDGLKNGPIMVGTGFFLNRKAIYNSSCERGLDTVNLRDNFGPSNVLIKILSQDIKAGGICLENLHEAEFLASCSYENGTKWGDGVGFYYFSVVEDTFTGYRLHCKGWKSVYLNPKRAAFLGSTTTNLNDVLTQYARWSAGLGGIGISRYCPLLYGPSRKQLPLLHRWANAWVQLFFFSFIPYWCFAIIPQLCLLHGVPTYSKVSSLSFTVLACILLASLLKNLHEALAMGGNITSWWNAERAWILKMLTCWTYGSIEATMKSIGLRDSDFIPTNKFIDNDQDRRYRQGIYDFQTSDIFLVSFGMTVILNLVCLVGGSMRVVQVGNWDEMAGQMILSGLILVLSKPVIEGMIWRKDKGRFPTTATLKSIATCIFVLVLGPIILFR